MVQCVVLAGNSETDRKVADLTSQNINNKALVPINGQPMIQYIISALKKSDLVDDMVIVGPKQELTGRLKGESQNFEIIEKHESGKVLDNLLKGIDFLKPQNNILVVTSDIPLLTPEAIDNFINQCDDKLDLLYPVIPKEANQKEFPQVERTYVNLSNGSFTGGNVFYINPAKVRPCYERVDRVIRNRKNPLLMATNFGISFLAQFLMGKLSLKQAEAKISQILQIQAKVIVSHYPELGIDIDKSSDMKLAEKIIDREKVYV
ncbi:NTP transferase domain-containing protein [Natranaerobius thermophilus]|uniref:MobA-like NTP transferase domain-containing protein n=1 Tax=Natranaerobius thermophilus (strain ATCC BAA-1301 / DSM 18059 / JW/NM-WN-LF) TaxID=457570 RepID=B2A3N0_NATTJ|nr:NTP transferase domain-containing protein [Natranaerobius thermophilus]ACB83656.1 conserved hypothetical protein [Natranaerobius thermophilus JW/NM-WN-LF]